ncbi:MAG: ATP-binding cassette domain-containing protein [Nanoarchaeota archaeon]|nr:ATP-binding cassette domain-containing protein [Nanoarchaeota archaeon]
MKTIIELKNLSKSFGGLKVLDNVSMKINEGQSVLITGPNGCGKTTLLRCISLLENFDSGEIIICKHRVTPDTPKEEREKIIKNHLIGFVFQEPHPWYHLKVIDNLTKPLMVIKRMPKNQALKKAGDLLDKVGLGGKKEEYPYFLSGGQKRKLIIARTLIVNPKILLLDEISANLDRKSKEDIFRVINKVSKKKTLIIVTHERDELKGIAHKTVRLPELPAPERIMRTAIRGKGGY